MSRGEAHADLRVRRLRPDEADHVGRLTLAAYDAEGRMTGPYREHLVDPGSRAQGATAVLVADRGGPALGTVTFVLPGDAEWEQRPRPAGDAGFRVLAVDPAAAGTGVGSALVSACLARARAAGARRLVVTTMDWMTRAHALYRRFGFVHRPDLDVRFPSGIGHTLTRDLTPDAAAHFPPPGPAPDPPPWYADAWGGAGRDRPRGGSGSAATPG